MSKINSTDAYVTMLQTARAAHEAQGNAEDAFRLSAIATHTDRATVTDKDLCAAYKAAGASLASLDGSKDFALTTENTVAYHGMVGAVLSLPVDAEDDSTAFQGSARDFRYSVRVAIEGPGKHKGMGRKAIKDMIASASSPADAESKINDSRAAVERTARKADAEAKAKAKADKDAQDKADAEAKGNAANDEDVPAVTDEDAVADAVATLDAADAEAFSAPTDKTDAGRKVSLLLAQAVLLLENGAEITEDVADMLAILTRLIPAKAA